MAFGIQQSFIVHIFFNYTLAIALFKALIEVFKLRDIINIEASREELSWIFTQWTNVPYVSCEAEFSCNRFVLMKMIYYLFLQQIDIVYIFLFTHMLVIIHKRGNIWVFNPSILFDKSLFYILIPVSTYNIGIYAILFFVPCQSFSWKMWIFLILFFIFLFSFVVLGPLLF